MVHAGGVGAEPPLNAPRRKYIAAKSIETSAKAVFFIKE
jgi:hypothetical protein